MENFIFCAVLMKTSCEVLRAIAEITKQKIVQNFPFFIGYYQMCIASESYLSPRQTTLMEPFVKSVFQSQMFDSIKHNTSNFLA